MSSLYLLIPIAVVLVVITTALYVWALRNGQYEDLDKEAHRILFDDPEQPPKAGIDSQPPRKGPAP